jgi:small subunit ribosomal protein S21
MPRVKVHDNESLESALRRFKKKLQRSGVLKQYRNREFYEKPSEKRRRKQKEASKKPFRKKR